VTSKLFKTQICSNKVQHIPLKHITLENKLFSQLFQCFKEVYVYFTYSDKEVLGHYNNLFLLFVYLDYHNSYTELTFSVPCHLVEVGDETRSVGAAMAAHQSP
jgi:hypothetical protein